MDFLRSYCSTEDYEVVDAAAVDDVVVVVVVENLKDDDCEAVALDCNGHSNCRLRECLPDLTGLFDDDFAGEHDDCWLSWHAKFH
jgi:hypothetical protein